MREVKIRALREQKELRVTIVELLQKARRELSGTSVRRNRGLGKEGNRYLRKALYMPALVAIKYNASLRHFASRLRAAGKPKMSIVCAIMRKLIHIAFGVLKHQKPFNP
jgi:transposase